MTDRITSKYIEDENGCWVWQAQMDPTGYGRLRHPYSQYAHRAVWYEVHGPVPVGLELDHLCRNRGCVNPAHLEPVTRSENQRRSPVTPATRTHCPQGHEYTEENTHIKGDGRRRCRICRRDQQRIRRQTRGRR